MEQGRYSLRRLCEVYVSHLAGKGKTQSAKHAASVFKCHLYDVDADLAGKPAKAITRRDITGLIRRCHEKGLVRTGGILRAYMSAAFSLAGNAEGNPHAPSELLGFEIEVNPVLGVQTTPVRAGDRTLSRDEMQTYMRHLWGESLADRFLLLHLLTAGQRVSQLQRTRIADYDADEGTIRLLDPKGRRTTPREHLLPMGPLACELIEVLIERAKDQAAKIAKRTGGQVDPNPSLWVSVGGAAMTVDTTGKRIAEVASEMKGQPFDARDIRRSCETLLAGLGVNRDVRAQLLSHGLSGVQDKHYDRHGYIDEKRNALQKWEVLLAGIAAGGKPKSNVIPLRRRRVA